MDNSLNNSTNSSGNLLHHQFPSNLNIPSDQSYQNTGQLMSNNIINNVPVTGGQNLSNQMYNSSNLHGAGNVGIVHPMAQANNVANAHPGKIYYILLICFINNVRICNFRAKSNDATW